MFSNLVKGSQNSEFWDDFFGRVYPHSWVCTHYLVPPKSQSCSSFSQYKRHFGVAQDTPFQREPLGNFPGATCSRPWLARYLKGENAEDLADFIGISIAITSGFPWHGMTIDHIMTLTMAHVSNKGGSPSSVPQRIRSHGVAKGFAGCPMPRNTHDDMDIYR